MFKVDDENELLFICNNNNVKMRYYGCINYFANEIQSEINYKCNLEMKIEYDSLEKKESDMLFINVLIKNKIEEKMGMIIVKLAIPNGCEVNYIELRKLKEKEIISFFELENDVVIIYLRGMKELEVREMKIVCNCKVCGEFASKVSVIYEYYNDEYKYYVDGMNLRINDCNYFLYFIIKKQKHLYSNI